MSRRRSLRPLLLTVGTLLCLLALSLVIELRPPAWWSPALSMSDALSRTGERFEQGCVSEIYRIRSEPGPWAIRLREEDVNAWLAARLPLWCEHVGVERLGDVQVHFSADTVEVATMMADLPTIAVASFRPTVAGQWLQPNLGAVRLGRLPVPFLTEGTVKAVIETLGTGEGDLRSVLLPMLRGESVDTTFELADRRRVRVRDIEVREGELLMELETLPAAAAPAK